MNLKKKDHEQEKVIYITKKHIAFTILIIIGILITSFIMYGIYLESLDDYDYVFITTYKYESLKLTMFEGDALPISDMQVIAKRYNITGDLHYNIPFELFDESTKKEITLLTDGCHIIIQNEYLQNADSIIILKNLKPIFMVEL